MNEDRVTILELLKKRKNNSFLSKSVYLSNNLSKFLGFDSREKKISEIIHSVSLHISNYNIEKKNNPLSLFEINPELKRILKDQYPSFLLDLKNINSKEEKGDKVLSYILKNFL